MTILLRHRARATAVTLTTLLLGAWFVPSFLSAERYRRRLEAGLERKLKRPVAFSALSYRLLPRPGFSIYGVVVKDDPSFGAEPFARVERIDCDLRWRSLWRSELDLAALHLTRPTFNIVRRAQGEWNVENLLHRLAGVGSPGNLSAPDDPQRSDIDLEADDARLNFKVGADKKPFAVTEVEAGLRIEPGRRLVRFRLAGNPVRTDIAFAAPGQLELSGEWTPGQVLDGPLEATLKTRRSLLYNWAPLLTGRNPEIYGVLDFEARLTGSLRSLKIEGQGRLDGLHRWESLPPSDSMTVSVSVQGGFDRTRGKAEIESLDASFADSRLHLTGSVEKIAASPEVDLVIALGRSRVEDLLALGHRLSGLSSSFGVSGRVDGLVTIQGRWNARRYAGFAGARNVLLHTASGTFPVSDLNVTIDNQEARLAPARITLTPRLELSVEGLLGPSGPAEKGRPEAGAWLYDLLISAKAAPLHDLVGYARRLGVRVAEDVEAEGGATARFHLTGTAWPPAAPALSGNAELRGVRLLVPGVTEPIRLAEARVQVNGDRIVAGPLVAAFGASVFTGRLEHQGDRSQPWMFDLHADRVSLEEGSLWFDALGHRTGLPLLERIPGLRSLAARRSASASLFSSLRAQGSFATPAVTYRSVTLTDFRTFAEVFDRTIRLSRASFRAAGGHGQGSLEVNLAESPALVTADLSLESAKVQALASHFPAGLRSARGLLSGRAHVQSRGLTRPEFAANLQGEATVRLKNVSLGGFDPLTATARATSLGELDPGRGDLGFRSATVAFEIRDGRATLSPSRVEIGGALFRLSGSYPFNGTVDFDVHADFRRVTRRWLDEEGTMLGAKVADFRLIGPVDRLAVVPGVQLSRGLATETEEK
jgi:uncharacterized protein involved in outer membrane biogenesis